MGQLPLAGIRILDLSQDIAGPYATKQFSDFGADVLKIERPDGGDVSRRIGPFPDDEPHPERSGMFMELNTGKRSITLNLKTATGQHILRRLAADADMVVESFRPGTLERLGLTAEALSAANPAASLVRISSFGQTGPYRDLEADDMLAYAMGGVLAITVEGDREPLKIGLYAPLFLAGAVAAGFIFGAFTGARRSGVGEQVDISIHEVLAASMDRGGTNLVAHEYSGSLFFERRDAQRSMALPQGVYPCRDGYVHIVCHLMWWDRFCRTIGRPELIEDERLVSNLADIAYAPEIDALLYPWLLERSKQEVMEAGQREGLVVSAINTAEDVANDPHLREREFFQHIDHPSAGTVTLPGFPFLMHGTPGEIRRAPLLGEHNSAVLTEQLGYSKEEVVILRQRNVI